VKVEATAALVDAYSAERNLVMDTTKIVELPTDVRAVDHAWRQLQ
jgi:hypothetical protein